MSKHHTSKLKTRSGKWLTAQMIESSVSLFVLQHVSSIGPLDCGWFDLCKLTRPLATQLG